MNSENRIITGFMIAASSAMITYMITKKTMEYEQNRKRKKLNEMRKLSYTKNREALKNVAISKASSSSAASASASASALSLRSGIKIPNSEIKEIYLWEVEHLGDRFESEAKHITNTMHGMRYENEHPTFEKKNEEDKKKRTEYNQLIGTHECVLADLVRKPGYLPISRAYVRAGARRTLHFDPVNVNAAIVTCGGLCPGLNNVVREITNALYHMYDIKGKVWGIRGGK